METDEYYEILHTKSGRKFHDRALLRKSMTAPDTEEANYEGHRHFAQIGESLMEFILAHGASQMGLTRAKITQLLNKICSRNFRASVAESKCLIPYIKCNRRQKDGPSQVTSSSTISALVYAAWVDSDGNWDETIQVMKCLGLYPFGKAGYETKPAPEEEFAPSNGSEEVSFSECELANEQPQANTFFSEYIEPGALDLTVIEGKALSKAASDTVTSSHCNDSSQETSKARQNFSQPLSPSISLDLSCSSDAFAGFSLGSDEMAFLGQGNEDTDNVQGENGFWNTQEQISHLTGGDEYCNLDVSEEAFETSSIRSTNLLDRQKDLASGSSLGEQGAMTPSNIVEDHSAVLERPGLQVNNPQRHRRESVRAAKGRSTTSKHERIRRMRPPNKSGTVGSATDLYIAHERRKSLDHNLGCPEDYILSSECQTQLVGLDLEDYGDTLRIMNFILGGCEVFVILQDVMKAYRQKTQTKTASPLQDLSFTETLRILRDLDGNIAYHTLLKHCHTLYFTRKAMLKYARVTEGFITVNPDGAEPQSKRRRGNPLNYAEAAITKAIMSEMHPDSKEGSPVYARIYAEVTGIRRYGQRLDRLVNVFGLGMLGLIPLTQNVSAARQAFGITHDALFKTTDNVFANMVHMTDECQGEHLRKLARAVEPIVEGIYHRTIDNTILFGIDDVEIENIVKYPKGAPELIDLVSRATGGDTES